MSNSREWVIEAGVLVRKYFGCEIDDPIAPKIESSVAGNLHIIELVANAMATGYRVATLDMDSDRNQALPIDNVEASLILGMMTNDESRLARLQQHPQAPFLAKRIATKIKKLDVYNG